MFYSSSLCIYTRSIAVDSPIKGLKVRQSMRYLSGGLFANTGLLCMYVILGGANVEKCPAGSFQKFELSAAIPIYLFDENEA